MPVYQYKGLRSDGQGTAGVIDAESLKGARHKLRQGGVYPTDVSEQRQSDGVGRGSILSSGVGGAVLTAQERAILTRQLATLLTAGLPLIDALAVLIEQTEKKSIQSLLAEVREQIRGGKALSRALEAFPQILRPSICIWCVPEKRVARWKAFWSVLPNSWTANSS